MSRRPSDPFLAAPRPHPPGVPGGSPAAARVQRRRRCDGSVGNHACAQNDYRAVRGMSSPFETATIPLPVADSAAADRTTTRKPASPLMKNILPAVLIFAVLI